jgi:hypothetical protein
MSDIDWSTISADEDVIEHHQRPVEKAGDDVYENSQYADHIEHELILKTPVKAGDKKAVDDWYAGKMTPAQMILHINKLRNAEFAGGINEGVERCEMAARGFLFDWFDSSKVAEQQLFYKGLMLVLAACKVKP